MVGITRSKVILDIFTIFLHHPPGGVNPFEPCQVLNLFRLSFYWLLKDSFAQASAQRTNSYEDGGFFLKSAFSASQLYELSELWLLVLHKLQKPSQIIGVTLMRQAVGFELSSGWARIITFIRRFGPGRERISDGFQILIVLRLILQPIKWYISDIIVTMPMAIAAGRSGSSKCLWAQWGHGGMKNG